MALAARGYVRADAVRTVLDVGANHGQFARTALHAFPEARIHCFEPLPSAAPALQSLAESASGRIDLHPFALGDKNGEIEFNVTSFSPSSSVLPVAAPAEAIKAQLELEATTRVPVRRLADCVADFAKPKEIILKLDVQGYEAVVLRGAGDFLNDVHLVIGETIFAPLYSGQATLRELCEILERAGLRYREAFGVIREPTTGEPLWQDSVFVRS